MKAKKHKQNVGKFISAVAIAVFVSCVSQTEIFANGITAVEGKIYSNEGKSWEYDFSSMDKYELVSQGRKTFGTFGITGNIIDTTFNSDVPTYIVDEGQLEFNYSYSNVIENIDEYEWHVVNDKSKKVNNIKLKEKVGKGTLIVQTSKDGKKWVETYSETNAFENIPIRVKSFYKTEDSQLENGCFYRVIVAYELSKKVESTKILFVNLDNNKYKKKVEVYDFYIGRKSTNEKNGDDNTKKYHLGEKIKTKQDSGYSGELDIDRQDAHYGWDLGEFYVKGYTRNTKDKNNNDVFLKNAGDKVTLYFDLNQDIDKLNGKDTLSVSDDKNGYDKYFEINRTDFGRGTLIVRYTDHENVAHNPIVYTNYLEANTAPGVDTVVQLFDEGDYEVSLDYEIENKERNIIGTTINFLPEYSNYKIFFKFSVRNGNCMAFPFDVKTKGELVNNTYTPNGFYIDLAKSRYLEVNVKKSVLNNKGNELVEDTRSNRPAKDGDQFIEEGIYTITTNNLYTGQETVKKIYVGDDNIMKATVINEMPINEIKQLVAKGAVINPDGTIDGKIAESSIENTKEIKNKQTFRLLPVILITIGIVLIVAIVIIIVGNKKNKEK